MNGCRTSKLSLEHIRNDSLGIAFLNKARSTAPDFLVTLGAQRFVRSVRVFGDFAL